MRMAKLFTLALFPLACDVASALPAPAELTCEFATTEVYYPTAGKCFRVDAHGGSRVRVPGETDCDAWRMCVTQPMDQPVEYGATQSPWVEGEVKAVSFACDEVPPCEVELYTEEDW